MDDENADVPRTFAASFLNCIFLSDIKLSRHISLAAVKWRWDGLRSGRAEVERSPRDVTSPAETPQSVFLSTKLNFNSSVCRLIRR